jgi:hypothetical protein
MSFLSHEDLNVAAILKLWTMKDSLKQSKQDWFDRATEKEEESFKETLPKQNYKEFPTELSQRPQ